MFESVLGRGDAPKSRLGLGVLVSILLHLIAIGVVLTRPIEPALPARKDPDLTMIALRSVPPPPPPLVSARTPLQTKRVAKKIVPRITKVIQPKEIPTLKPPELEKPPDPEPDPEDAPTEGGVQGGVQGGQVGGALGGVFGALGTPSDVLPFSAGMTRPEQIEGRPPEYSREALRERVEGTMLVKCIVTVQGDLKECQVIKSVPHMEAPVLSALATYRYRPATFQGAPVAVKYLFTIRLVMPTR